MASSSQKPEGRAFADNIRQPEEMKNALVWLFDTDASQLTGFLRSGPSAGRLKLLLACSKAVCEPPVPAPTSSDGPPAAPASVAPAASVDAAASSGDTKPGVSTSKGSTTTSPASVDAPTKAAEPEPEGAGDCAVAPSVDAKAADEPPSDAPATSVAKGDTVEAPTTSAGGGTESAEAVTSEPSGQTAPSEATSRFDHVAPPTFVDTSEVPRRAKVSTRQVLCCRETCAVCYQACCGYASELPQDSHFIASDVHHRCKACYRASRNKATEATTSTQASGDTSQDTHDPWYHTSDPTGSWQQSPAWSSGHWEWDAWHAQWMWR